MPELKWTSPAALEPGRSYVVFASQLPSAGMRAVPAFLRHTMRITRQLRNSPGLVAYSLRADIAGHQFWTLSVWQDGAALQAFVRAEPHATTMRELARYTKDPVFTRWTTESPVPLPTWDEVEARLLTSVSTPASTRVVGSRSGT